MKLVTRDEVKVFLEMTGATHDGLLDFVIESVSSKIERHLNRNLESTTYTEYYNGGRNMYYVSAYPIDVDNVAVTVNDNTGYSANSEYYIWENDGLIEFVTAPSTSLPKSIKIVYIGGYVADGDGVLTTIPADLKYACVLQSAFEFRRRNDVGLESVSLPDGSVNMVNRSDFIKEVRKILKNHRRSSTGK